MFLLRINVLHGCQHSLLGRHNIVAGDVSSSAISAKGYFVTLTEVTVKCDKPLYTAFVGECKYEKHTKQIQRYVLKCKMSIKYQE
jgi:hypothetical protein